MPSDDTRIAGEHTGAYFVLLQRSRRQGAHIQYVAAAFYDVPGLPVNEAGLCRARPFKPFFTAFQWMAASGWDCCRGKLSGGIPCRNSVPVFIQVYTATTKIQNNPAVGMERSRGDRDPDILVLCIETSHDKKHYVVG